ncbi:flagellar hook-length control protein FliK [Aquidulcibacter sp.]|uniref:flagellar hook-length control protein FliK n=1 Tax=Aquidulcibacter sp. TaxID=2052990 RepID=UPI0037C0F58D
MMDSIAEAPPSRRARPSALPINDMGEATGLSFADTMIGLVQAPTPQEPTKSMPDLAESIGAIKLAPDQSTSDALVTTDISATPALVGLALPVAITPVELSSILPAAGTKQEGLGTAFQATAAQSTTATLGQLEAATSDASGPEATSTTFKADTSLALPTKSVEGLVMSKADQTATEQALAIKTQATASQGLFAGLAALGQTQKLVAEDSQLAQFVATATGQAVQSSPLPTNSTTAQIGPAIGQAVQSSPLPTNSTTAQTGPAIGQAVQSSPLPTNSTTAQTGPAIDLALAADPQGPGAARSLEAQSAEARGAKANSSAGWLANSTGLFATDDAGLQSAPNAALTATPTQPATAAITAGLVPNLAKAAAKAEETKVAATDAGGMLAGANGAADAASSTTTDWAGAPATDTSPKPTLVQPHTIPMLAAAMMRRISNGLKEFTLRLDPPELGRVDVRLTVGTDKKVRAVVSTDRPEALKDLALSARDLTRALQEAGLELEENGLSFSMNDQGSSQQNRDANQQQSARLKNSLDGYETSEAAKPEQTVPLSAHLSGPVERWQRARIAMTA